MPWPDISNRVGRDEDVPDRSPLPRGMRRANRIVSSSAYPPRNWIAVATVMLLPPHAKGHTHATTAAATIAATTERVAAAPESTDAITVN